MSRLSKSLKRAKKSISRGLSKTIGKLGTKIQRALVPKMDLDMPTPAASATPIEEEQFAPELGGSGSEGDLRSKRRGRGKLRIDLRTGSAGAGGSGINVPRN